PCSSHSVPECGGLGCYTFPSPIVLPLRCCSDCPLSGASACLVLGSFVLGKLWWPQKQFPEQSPGVQLRRFGNGFALDSDTLVRRHRATPTLQRGHSRTTRLSAPYLSSEA